MEIRSDVRAFLDEPRFGVLGTINSDGSPQQTVMWFELRGDTIMMNTKRGRRKDRNLLSDGRASVCMEEGQRYVTIEGTIRMIDDQETAQADIAALARRYETPEAAEAMIASTTGFAAQERVTLILSIDKIDTHGFDGEG